MNTEDAAFFRHRNGRVHFLAGRAPNTDLYLNKSLHLSLSLSLKSWCGIFRGNPLKTSKRNVAEALCFARFMILKSRRRRIYDEKAPHQSLNLPLSPVRKRGSHPADIFSKDKFLMKR